MTTQQNPAIYAQAIQYQLDSILGSVPVFVNFNRNWNKTQTKFVTWQLRNVHQPVFTGTTQSNKGIDTPVFQISVFAVTVDDAFNISNTILQSLHGYSGILGNPATTGFYISKADVVWLYNTYDNEIGMQQIILDCTLYVPS
jgi:hypothetical protein